MEGKICGIITTCGYDFEYGISPFENGIKLGKMKKNLRRRNRRI